MSVMTGDYYKKLESDNRNPDPLSSQLTRDTVKKQAQIVLKLKLILQERAKKGQGARTDISQKSVESESVDTNPKYFVPIWDKANRKSHFTVRSG